mgnify:CR=1 FL=1
MPANGLTHDQREAAIEQAEVALLDGKRPGRIASALAAKWEISDTTARLIIKSARERLAERGRAAKAERDARLGLTIERRERLYEKAVERDELALAHAIERDSCELHGLYPDKSITVRDVSGRGKDKDELSDEELLAIAGGGRATSLNDGSESTGSGGRGTEAAEVAGEPVGLHDLHDAHLCDELAPPADCGEARCVGEGGDSAADAVHPAAAREIGTGEQTATGDAVRAESLHQCD